jgi:hypothetical protein
MQQRRANPTNGLLVVFLVVCVRDKMAVVQFFLLNFSSSFVISVPTLSGCTLQTKMEKQKPNRKYHQIGTRSSAADNTDPRGRLILCQQ